MCIVDQSDAVVDPLAMVIELCSASIAHSTVLARGEHVSITDVAVQLMLHVVVEDVLLGFAICALLERLVVEVLHDANLVRWVDLSGYVRLNDQQYV